MSTTVTYKGNTIATLTNETRTLTTAGTWLDANISITDSSNSSSSVAASHTIQLIFSDNTNADIDVYYNDNFLNTIITSYIPSSYNGKNIIKASLDSTAWYDLTAIPLNTELVDYTKAVNNTAIGESGAFEQEWYYASDYITINKNMTFSYTASYWFYIAFYDISHNFISSLYIMNDGTQDQNDGNTGHGVLNSAKIPTTASYVRLCGTELDNEHMSLIRTA